MTDDLNMTTGTDIEPPIGDNGSPVPPSVNDGGDDLEAALPDERTTAEVLYGDDEDDDAAGDDAVGITGGDSLQSDDGADAGNGEHAPRIDTSGWTAEDAATFTALQYEAESFQRDFQDLATAKARLERLKETDPQRAQALAVQVRGAEQELRERYGTLQNAAQQFGQGITGRRLESEKARMVNAIPELATDEGKAALKTYLTEGLGFKPEEITAPDHRLAKMAWQAMKYEELTSGKPQKKVVPKLTKRGAKAKGSKKAAPEKPKTSLDRTLESLYGPTPPRPTTPSRDERPSREEILYGRAS